MQTISGTRFLKGFFDFDRRMHGGKLTQERVDTVETPTLELLLMMQRDCSLQDLRFAAYMFATVYHETAATMRPISEYGRGRGKVYGNPVIYHVDNKRYENVFYGRGYVQLTWFDNYLKMSRDLDNKRIITNPESVKEPQTAYDIMSYGMQNGRFTGHRLSEYINPNRKNYTQARRVINGLDKAMTIAGYAQVFESVLYNSV